MKFGQVIQLNSSEKEISNENISLIFNLWPDERAKQRGYLTLPNKNCPPHTSAL